MISEEKMLSSLRQAKEELGHSPTISEYKSLNISPSDSYIRRRFGSWNKAKKKAGLSRCLRGESIDDVPDIVNKTQTEWENLSHVYRSCLRKRVKYAKEKMDNGCSECGFDRHPSALEFHHLHDKNEIISTMIANNRTIEDIENEIDKCVVLCSNCHRAETDDTFNF